MEYTPFEYDLMDKRLEEIQDPQLKGCLSLLQREIKLLRDENKKLKNEVESLRQNTEREKTWVFNELQRIKSNITTLHNRVNRRF